MRPYLRAANVTEEGLDLDDVKEMNFSPREQQHFALRPGDVLMTEGSGSLGSVGTSAVWRGADQVVCFQNTLLRLRARPVHASERFVAWVARYARGTGLLAGIAGGANIHHLSAERARRLPVPVPPMARQVAIADFLDAETARIDALIAKKRRMVGVLAERYLALVEAQLLDVSNETVPLGRLLVEPPRYGATEAGVEGPDEWPRYIRITDITGAGALRTGGIQRLSPERARPFLLGVGDLLFARTGATVGKVYRVTAEDLPCAFAGYLIRMRVDTRLVLSEIVEFWTRTQHYWRQVRAASIQATVENVSAERYSALLVPLSSPANQQHLLGELRQARFARERIVAPLERQLDLLQERRQALITAAVTGQIDIPGVGT